MSGRGRNVVIIMAAVSLLISGCGRPKLIPEKELVSLYVDMFIADQWLRDHPDERKIADTTLFFDPIFRKHGYNFEDYDKSMNYYVAHPDEFNNITTRVADELRMMTSAKQKAMDRKKAMISYRECDFLSDSLWQESHMCWPADSLDLAFNEEGAGSIIILASEKLKVLKTKD